MIAANLNEVKLSSLTEWFFKSLEELAKCHQKILCEHTDESKHLAHRHIFKIVVKVVEEKFKFLCFSSLSAICRADPPSGSKNILPILGNSSSEFMMFVKLLHSLVGLPLHRHLQSLS